MKSIYRCATGLYRPNVAIILQNEAGRILVCERIDSHGSWQFPQGGVDAGEDVVTALYREVREEIGLGPEDYRILEEGKGYRYEYPEGVKEQKKKKHNCVGQEQTYFLCKLLGLQRKVSVHQESPEFINQLWIEPSSFRLEWLPDFKAEVYTQVFQDFFGVTL